MQTEQIGRIKKSFVGKSYSITAGDEFKITVGKSSLVMNADGSIIITGTSIITQAEGENKVIGKDVLINPPGASAGGSQADEPSSGSVSDASNIPGIVGGGFGSGLKGQPAQRGPDGLPIQGSDSDEYESNIAVDNYDKDSNYLGSYSLDDNPSGLSAFVPIVVGGEAAIAGAGAIVGGTIYEASKDSGEAIVNAAKSANKTMEGFRAAQMVMAASIANSVQGIFPSDGPKTGNDALDDVFENSKKSDEGEYGYKYPGTQDELVENLGGIEGAVQDIVKST